MIFEWADAINGGIELCGAGAVIASACKVRRHGSATGVHVSHVGYGLLVNWWSVYYYAHIEQPISFWCGVAFALAITTWAVLIWRCQGGYNDGTG